MLLTLAAIARSFAAPTSAPAAGEELSWLDSLDDAYKKAQHEQRPILVYVGANWCKPCHALREEMNKPAAREKLAGWTRVYIDFDKSPSAAQSLGVSALPALRVLTPTGAVAASTEGFMSATDLVAWLDASGQKPMTPPGEEFSGNDPPNEANLAKLLSAVVSGTPTMHEAAIRRLAPHAKVAGKAVVELLAKGSLNDRLAALDLLQEWHAPVDQIDPWHPQTLTEARLDALRKWASDPTPTTKPAAPTTRSSSSSGEIREDFDALLAASTDEAAIAMREHLARRGDSIRPELESRLNSAATDRQRARLGALRLRLASTDKLAMSWPGGFERLASADAQVRRDAINELATRVTPEDEPFLLQLFSSADPFVRESSLRLMRGTGGGGSAALGKLLSDPEPNVRAAVLKQFAENPDAAIVAQIVKYISAERDVDLLVHAIRVLRANKTKASADCLLTLLTDPSWRVRAEAIEALNDSGFGNFGSIVPALRNLLDDPDGYVVSRAVVGLLSSNDASLIKPIFAAASKHPELLPEMIGSLRKTSSQMQSAAAPELKKLVDHQAAGVGPAALRALCETESADASKLILSALQNTAPEMRIAAADGIVVVARRLRPQNGYVTRSRFAGFGSEQVQVDPTDWLSDWQAGKGRPKWMNGVIAPLEKMLASESAAERGSGALALVMLGKSDRALQILFDDSAKHPELQAQAAAALSWLPMDNRLERFNALLARHPTDDAVGEIISEFADPPDPRAADTLWALVEANDATPHLANAVMSALRETYFGNQYYNASQLPASKIRKVTDLASRKASEGSDMQRLVALSLLLLASPDDAAEIAGKTVADANASEWARLDALQVQLLSLPRAKAQQAASAALAAPNLGLRKVAVPYLAGGQQAIQQFRGSIYLYNPRGESNVVESSGVALLVKPPAGVTVESVKPLLSDPDPDLAAHAGYLLATLGDRSGLDSLVKYWREHVGNDMWTQEVYRAITALDDDSLTPILTEIYQSYEKSNQYELRQFYWTIRSMHGPNILKLRKRMRDELGMEQLK